MFYINFVTEVDTQSNTNYRALFVLVLWSGRWIVWLVLWSGRSIVLSVISSLMEYNRIWKKRSTPVPLMEQHCLFSLITWVHPQVFSGVRVIRSTFLCSVLYTILFSFAFFCFFLSIVLSVPRMVSGHPFDLFKLSLFNRTFSVDNYLTVCSFYFWPLFCLCCRTVCQILEIYLLSY